MPKPFALKPFAAAVSAAMASSSSLESDSTVFLEMLGSLHFLRESEGTGGAALGPNNVYGSATHLPLFWVSSGFAVCV